MLFDRNIVLVIKTLIQHARIIIDHTLALNKKALEITIWGRILKPIKDVASFGNNQVLSRFIENET